MSFSELRVFYVVLTALLVAISWFTLSVFQSKSDVAVTKIARVNQELIKLTQKSTDKVETVPLIDDAKLSTAYVKGSPQQRIKDNLKTILDYPDAKTLVSHFEANKAALTGSVWTINAPNNSFTTSDWQAQAALGDWSQSLTSVDIAPNEDNTYTVIATVQPLGSNRDSKQPQSYWLTVKLNDTSMDATVNGQLESYK